MLESRRHACEEHVGDNIGGVAIRWVGKPATHIIQDRPVVSVVEDPEPVPFHGLAITLKTTHHLGSRPERHPPVFLSPADRESFQWRGE
jgi:hypothetical protein